MSSLFALGAFQTSRLSYCRFVVRSFSASTHHSAQPCSIKTSEDEVRSGRLTEQNLELAVRHIHHDGLVVVENVINHEVLDRLNEKMVKDALALRSRGDKSPFNYNKGNLQQDPPPVREYFDRSVFLSKWEVNV